MEFYFYFDFTLGGRVGAALTVSEHDRHNHFAEVKSLKFCQMCCSMCQSLHVRSNTTLEGNEKIATYYLICMHLVWTLDGTVAL